MWIPPTVYGILCLLYHVIPPPHIICGVIALTIHLHTKGVRLRREESEGPVCPSRDEQMAASLCISVGVWFYMMGESIFGAPMGYFLLSASTFADYIHAWEPDGEEDPEEDEDPPSGSSSEYP